jgi:enterobactin synthetase component D
MLVRIEPALTLEPPVVCCAARFSVAELHADSAGEYGVTLPLQVQAAVPKRRAEYIAGRESARRALMRLHSASGDIDIDIDIGADRAPVWPAGIVGSITHCSGYAAAAVAPASALAAIGIDSERRMSARTRSEVGHLIANDDETASASRDYDELTWYSLLFSAKESLFKALHPHVRRMFGFEQAHFELLDREHFRVTLRRPLPPFAAGRAFVGRCRVDGDEVHSAIVLASLS